MHEKPDSLLVELEEQCAKIPISCCSQSGASSPVRRVSLPIREGDVPLFTPQGCKRKDPLRILPIELVVQIFSYLPFSDRLSCMMVDKYWRLLISNSSGIFSELVFDAQNEEYKLPLTQHNLSRFVKPFLQLSRKWSMDPLETIQLRGIRYDNLVENLSECFYDDEDSADSDLAEDCYASHEDKQKYILKRITIVNSKDLAELETLVKFKKAHLAKFKLTELVFKRDWSFIQKYSERSTTNFRSLMLSYWAFRELEYLYLDCESELDLIPLIPLLFPKMKSLHTFVRQKFLSDDFERNRQANGLFEKLRDKADTEKMQNLNLKTISVNVDPKFGTRVGTLQGTRIMDHLLSKILAKAPNLVFFKCIGYEMNIYDTVEVTEALATLKNLVDLHLEQCPSLNFHNVIEGLNRAGVSLRSLVIRDRKRYVSTNFHQINNCRTERELLRLTRGGFQCLKGLKTLDLMYSGINTSVLMSLLRTAGPTLEVLRLGWNDYINYKPSSYIEPTPTQEVNGIHQEYLDLVEIVKLCPNLKELSIPMGRHLGDHTLIELGAYWKFMRESHESTCSIKILDVSFNCITVKGLIAVLEGISGSSGGTTTPVDNQYKLDHLVIDGCCGILLSSSKFMKKYSRKIWFNPRRRLWHRVSDNPFNDDEVRRLKLDDRFDQIEI